MVRALLERLWPFANTESDDEDEVRTWDFIPRWQYGGWQAETGGLTVAEQEQALEEIHEQAEDIKESEAVDERRG